MKKVAVLPILGPDLVYGKVSRDDFLRTMTEEYEQEGFSLTGDENRLIYPKYLGRISTFVDCTTEAKKLLDAGYKVKLTFGHMMPDPVMMDRLMGQRLLVLPLVQKGSLMDEQVRLKYQDRFESNGFNYVSDVNYKNYLKYGRIFLNPVSHDRVSYKLFSLNLVMAAKRGFRIYVVGV